jgi:hypothetical protein
MSFIAGQYFASYNGQSLGQAADGLRLSWQTFGQLVRGDNFAQAPQDEVYQGMEMDLAARLIEYNAAGVAAAMWPAGSFLSMGVVGRLAVGSALAKQIVLTALAGTPAAATPASLTFPTAKLKENFPVEVLFAPALREVPLRWRIFPNSSGVFGTQT